MDWVMKIYKYSQNIQAARSLPLTRRTREKKEFLVAKLFGRLTWLLVNYSSDKGMEVK